MKAEHALQGSGVESSQPAFVCFQEMPLCLWPECACAHTGVCPASEDIPAVPASVCVPVCVHAHMHMPLVLCA